MANAEHSVEIMRSCGQIHSALIVKVDVDDRTVQ
ncbi:hypothetical protein SNEBB_003471, partial [Seison nebaliae]